MAPDEQDSLPRAFRGYDRDATDELLRRHEDRHRALRRERDELEAQAQQSQARLDQLEHELARHREQVQAVGKALIKAEQVREQSDRASAEAAAAAEQQAAERLAQAESEVAELRARAEHDAAALLRDAEARAAELAQAVQRHLGERRVATEEFLDDLRARLGALVREVVDRATQPSAAQPAERPARELASDAGLLRERA